MSVWLVVGTGDGLIGCCVDTHSNNNTAAGGHTVNDGCLGMDVVVPGGVCMCGGAAISENDSYASNIQMLTGTQESLP